MGWMRVNEYGIIIMDDAERRTSASLPSSLGGRPVRVQVSGFERFH